MSPYRAWRGPAGALSPLIGYRGGVTQITSPAALVYEVFTTSGTWDWEAAGAPDAVDVLVVAGGGSGGRHASGGGGGGAGQVLEALAVAVAGDVAVTVGAGGAAQVNNGWRGNSGDASSFGATAAVGGGGGGGDSSAGFGGGSGGGGGSRNNTNGYSEAGGVAGDALATAGGRGWSSTTVATDRASGGGGGASAAGDDAEAVTGGGDGGAGVSLASLGWGDAVVEGAPEAVGGGGGGTAVYNGNGYGLGGYGGGGRGSISPNATNNAGEDGTVSTGGGGGGAHNAVSGAGGSGLVIVRYTSIPESGVQSDITSVAAVAGVGTTTLTWAEANSPDSVTIYRDGVSYDTVTGGTLTWTSGAMADDLYVWTIVPVTGGVPGSASDPLSFGNMTADVYIDTVNGDDANDGTTPALAVKTIQAAGLLASGSGNVFCIRGGTYAEYNALLSGSAWGGALETNFLYSGTSVARNYFRTFPGETVVVDGSSIDRAADVTDPSTSNQRGPQLLHFHGDYWTIEGWPGFPLELRNSAGAGLSFEGKHYCEARYVYSHDHNSNGINGEGSDNCLVEEFCVHSIYSYNDGETGDGVCFSVGNDNTVRRGIVAWCSDDGVDFIGGTGNDVENVLAYQCGKDNTGAAVLGNGNAFKMGGGGIANAGSTIRHSIAVGTRVYAFDCNGSGGITFEHNVSAFTGNRGYVGRGYDTLVFRNNASLGETADLIDSVGGTGTAPVEEYNTWQTPPGITVATGDFLSTIWSSSWRTWDDVVAAGYYMTDSTGQLPGNGKDGEDLGVVTP